MSAVAQMKDAFNNMTHEEISRTLFDLKMHAIYSVEGFADYISVQPTVKTNSEREDVLARREREREAEAVALAVEDARQRFLQQRAEVLAEEFAAQRLALWTENRPVHIPVTAAALPPVTWWGNAA